MAQAQRLLYSSSVTCSPPVRFRALVSGGGFGDGQVGHEVAGGVAVGLAVGWLVAEIRKRITDTQVNVTI